MSADTEKMAPPHAEVLMLAPEIVWQIEQLSKLGWLDGPAAGNAVVVRRLLAERGSRCRCGPCSGR